jgi:hypothetical protein
MSRYVRFPPHNDQIADAVSCRLRGPDVDHVAAAAALGAHPARAERWHLGSHAYRRRSGITFAACFALAFCKPCDKCGVTLSGPPLARCLAAYIRRTIETISRRPLASRTNARHSFSPRDHLMRRDFIGKGAAETPA